MELITFGGLCMLAVISWWGIQDTLAAFDIHIRMPKSQKPHSGFKARVISSTTAWRAGLSPYKIS